jgi:glutamine amidotransferase
MCRHVAYWGPPIAPAALAIDAPSSLLAQCSTAREMSWGTENIDGWGFAATREDAAPQLYRSGLAMSDDAEGQQRLRQVSADRFIVHVRQMTPGSVRDPINSAPFSDGHDRFFTHNGYIADFRSGVDQQLLAKLSPERAAAIQGDTDSEVLFALVLDRLDTGASLDEAIRVVSELGELYGGRYNVLLWADSTMVATRWDNSLYTKESDGVIIASEPLDDTTWRVVPERTMVIVDDSGVREAAL